MNINFIQVKRKELGLTQKELAQDALILAHQKTLDALKNDLQLHRKFIVEAINKIEEVEI